jgi:hypothetical protein
MDFKSYITFYEDVLGNRENKFLRPKNPRNPPIGFSPEYMNLTSDAAGRKAAEKLISQGTDGKQAALLGNQVAQYVFDYSMKPYNVYRRVLAILSDTHLYSDEVVIQMAKKAATNATA